jgi:hypothetical protein
MKFALLLLLLCLSGCSWFHRKPPPPVTQQLIVTGVPAGSLLLVDGKQMAEGDASNRSHVIDVAPGEKRVVAVLSGDHRD